MKSVKQQIERCILHLGIAQIPLLTIIFFIDVSPLYPEQNHERDSSPPLVHGGDESQQNTVALQKHLDAANLYAKQNDFPKAIEQLHIMLEIDPQCIEAHIQLGILYSKIGKLDDALQSYAQVVKLRPDSFSAHYNLGVILARRGWFEKAETEYRLAIQLDPTQPLPHYQLGFVLAQQGKYEDALPAYKKAVALAPNASAHYQLANTYFRLGNRDEGERQLKKFRGIQARQLFDKAEQSFKSGNVQEAIKSYQRALDTDVKFAPAYARLGAIALQQGEFDDGIRHYRAYLELKPESMQARLTLGSAALKMKDFATAAEEFEQIIVKNPTDAYAFYGLGASYLGRSLNLKTRKNTCKKRLK